MRSTTQSSKMYLLLQMMVMLIVVNAVRARCDPLTQYEFNGQCCKMCGPGTSMTSFGTCLEPQCQECGKSDYQESYTSEPKCKLQPYCDRNKNFKFPVHDTKKQSVCLCQEGFHCSGELCLTCVPHSTCAEGHGAKSKGNHSYDTVCEECPEGTFSDEASWHGVCKKWRECADGVPIQDGGTKISDNICGDPSRTHIIVVVVVVVLIALIAIAAIIFYLFKGNRCDARRKVKDCFGSCWSEKWEPQRDATKPMTPAHELMPDDEVSMLDEATSQQQEGLPRAAEEHEEPSQEMSTDTGYTYNGNVVRQEDGKTEMLSRQESQTQTITDSMSL